MNEMVKEWKLRSGERYNAVSKDKINQGPILLTGCKGCHKFHNKARCHSDCNDKDSYRKLLENANIQFGAYCKQCRIQLIFGQGSSNVLQFKK